MKKILSSLALMGALTTAMIPLATYEKYCDGKKPSDLTFATANDSVSQVKAALQAQTKFCGNRA